MHSTDTFIYLLFMVEVTGLEPATYCLQSNRSTRWATPPLTWWVWLASNQRPPPYQDGALTNWATDPRLGYRFVLPLGLATTDKCERFSVLA